MTTYHLGQRASFDSAPCTIRYVGPVAGTQKDWLGVEWDDPTRGKHNGEHQGVRYFTCRSPSPTAASFIRPTRAADPTRTFVEAVQHKYAAELAAVQAGITQRQIEISGKVVEEVGFDKIRRQLAQLHALKIVLVDGLQIDRAAPDTIRETCPRIIDLDLSRNLFTACEPIVAICAELDFLKSLRLNGNRLLPISPSATDAARAAFHGIHTLGLDQTMWSWREICSFAQAFTSLTNLSASFNGLNALPAAFLPTISESNLTSITLEYNSFTSLSDLEALAAVTSLEKLHLKGNQVAQVQNPDRTVPLRFSERLSFIDLSFNAVSTWEFVDDLPSTIPGLTALRLSHNPVYEDAIPHAANVSTTEESFMLTVARIGRLKTLNFSNITAAERLNAEMFYLSRIGKALAAVPEHREQSVTQRHRRYAELCKLHGAPTVVRSGPSVNPNFLEARLIRITFTLALAQASETRVQEIPKAYDIYQLKGVAGRLFGHPPLDLRLVWETGEWDPVAGDVDEADSDEETSELDDRHEEGKWVRREVELEDGTRQVGFYVDDVEAKVRVELRRE